MKMQGRLFEVRLNRNGTGDENKAYNSCLSRLPYIRVNGACYAERFL